MTANGALEGREHDYTNRGWGHDFEIVTIHDKGQRLDMCGWGYGIEAGHFLILPNQETIARYRVDSIDYYTNPRDMWKAKLSYAPKEKQHV